MMMGMGNGSPSTSWVRERDASLYNVWYEPLPWFDQTVLHPVIRSQQRQVLKLEMVMVMGRMDKEGGIAGR